jgi:hypothetical protein
MKRLLLSMTIVAASVVLSQSAALANPNTLGPGQSLPAAYSYLTSNNMQYMLVLQGDNNLVLYRVSDWHVLWASNTNTPVPSTGVCNACYALTLVMKSDGNLVLISHKSVPFGTGNLVWQSNTSGNKGSTLVLQDDGNLVIYPATNATWKTDTNQY